MTSSPYGTITPEEAAAIRPNDVLEVDDSYHFLIAAPENQRRPRFVRNGLRGSTGQLSEQDLDAIDKIGAPAGWVDQSPEEDPRV